MIFSFFLLRPDMHALGKNIRHLVYYQGKYPADHWALKKMSLGDEGVIAFIKIEGAEFVIFLHPYDKRGYRSIVRLIDNNNMAGTFNRPFTSTEKSGLAIIVDIVNQAYQRVVPIAQSFKLGNNSQYFDENTKTICLGAENEPHILHAHVMGRGDPKKEYIPGVPLDGPVAGKLFLFEVYDKTELGNDRQVRWGKKEMLKVVNRLRNAILIVLKKSFVYQKVNMTIRV